MRHRPLIKVTYELKLITSEDEVTEVFDVSYDSEMYKGDGDSIDSMFVSMKMEDLKERYGNDILLLEYSVERESQLLH